MARKSPRSKSLNAKHQATGNTPPQRSSAGSESSAAEKDERASLIVTLRTSTSNQKLIQSFMATPTRTLPPRAAKRKNYDDVFAAFHAYKRPRKDESESPPKVQPFVQYDRGRSDQHTSFDQHEIDWDDTSSLSSVPDDLSLDGEADDGPSLQYRPFDEPITEASIEQNLQQQTASPQLTEDRSPTSFKAVSPVPTPVFECHIPEKVYLSGNPTPPASVASTAETVPDEADDLKSLAEQLLAPRNPIKPEPSGQPEVWADTRMELCETLYYYRSYHGGCYATGGFARAFMFANSSHSRDYMDGSVIIARAGGGMKRDDSGQMKMSKDQTEGATVSSVRNNMRQYNPVVIITADNNPQAQIQPPHPYCVLDYFKVTNVWWEKSEGKKILRLRFEKLNSKKTSWWQPKDTAEIAKPGTLDPPIVQVCPKCNRDSQQTYLQGWMCLQPDCENFWRFSSPASNDLRDPEEGILMYDPRFLKQHTPWPNDDSNLPLGSLNAELTGNSILGEDCSRAHWSGVVCPDCGRCNSRLDWTGWKCRNPQCSFEKTPPHALIPSSSLHDPFNPLSTSYMYSRDLHSPLVDMSVSFADNYRINRFTIPGVNGFITHMIANKTVVEEPEGPDAMFELLQENDIGLARRSMGHDHFTRHYVVNYGMPYKFIAATASSPFTESAAPITLARSRLNWAAQYLLSKEDTSKSLSMIRDEWKPKEFNEVLALGYLEDQKISYHDDGETGLGPTIATLSLGATGTMRIRMKARHFNGVSKAGVYDSEAPLPGCAEYDKRLQLQQELRDLEASDRKAYTQRLKAIPRELGLKSGGNAKDAITMTLSHGDIVVMHGAELQKFYEHSVDHTGKLRFALTCRYIDPESLSENDKPSYEVMPDEGDYDGTRLPMPGA
ncbi:unnamed protein product [Periconia digitata]|uniref:Alpha-ketoglutarate-dependent dioxygenase AlkB-like domain-containing protein n=1 Tax=Periconia digitata TaxID=1303443 RepID=A0A9W4U912_9PLEO|nr:unnamed protein product [Periconia digitata]